MTVDKAGTRHQRRSLCRCLGESQDRFDSTPPTGATSRRRPPRGGLPNTTGFYSRRNLTPRCLARHVLVCDFLATSFRRTMQPATDRLAADGQVAALMQQQRQRGASPTTAEEAEVQWRMPGHPVGDHGNPAEVEAKGVAAFPPGEPFDAVRIGLPVAGGQETSLRAAIPIRSLIGSPLGNGLNPLEKPEKPSRYSSRNQGLESSRKPRVSRRAVTLEDVTAMRGNPPVLSRRGVVVWT